MKQINETESVVATNSSAGGAIDGIGVGDKGEPGVLPKKKKPVVNFITFSSMKTKPK